MSGAGAGAHEGAWGTGAGAPRAGPWPRPRGLPIRPRSAGHLPSPGALYANGARGYQARVGDGTSATTRRGRVRRHPGSGRPTGGRGVVPRRADGIQRRPSRVRGLPRQRDVRCGRGAAALGQPVGGRAGVPGGGAGDARAGGAADGPAPRRPRRLRPPPPFGPPRGHWATTKGRSPWTTQRPPPSSPPLPPFSSLPSLEHLKKQAKHLLAAARRDDPQAAQRLWRWFPERRAFALSHAQLAVAREHGCAGWAPLRRARPGAPLRQGLR